jgi:acyl-CoA dehydrogenase
MPDEKCGDRSSPYFSAEHEILRAQIRRFVETEIKPRAQAWESAGFVPREVLHHMGKLGFFGIRYPAEYGGSEMDALASVVLAEELGRSTYGGVAITVLVHTDMASVHIYNSGTQAMRDRFVLCRTLFPVRKLSLLPSPNLTPAPM